METLTCEIDGHEWTREAKRGVKPKRCPEHKEAPTDEPRREPATAWEHDAVLAATVQKQGKPYTARLVARCVLEAPHGGDRDKFQTELARLGKTTVEDFATFSGIGKNTVRRYLRTWQAMSAAGVVPVVEELEPGKDAGELPDAKTWTEHYRAANPPKPKKEAEGGEGENGSDDDGTVPATSIPDLVEKHGGKPVEDNGRDYTFDTVDAAFRFMLAVPFLFVVLDSISGPLDPISVLVEEYNPKPGKMLARQYRAAWRRRYRDTNEAGHLLTDEEIDQRIGELAAARREPESVPDAA